MTDRPDIIGETLKAMPLHQRRAGAELTEAASILFRQPNAARTRLWVTDLERLAFANPEAFASMIANQRKALGLSLRQLAELCDISYQAIGDIERQKYDTITGRSIRTVSDAMALNADDLRAEIAAQHDTTDEVAA